MKYRANKQHSTELDYELFCTETPINLERNAIFVLVAYMACALLPSVSWSSTFYGLHILIISHLEHGDLQMHDHFFFLLLSKVYRPHI
jgi:hypothetical protein